MHVVWHCRFLLCFRPLLPGGKRAGISVSRLDYCDLLRRAALRTRSDWRIPGTDAFSLYETASVRRAYDDLAVCLRCPRWKDKIAEPLRNEALLPWLRKWAQPRASANSGRWNVNKMPWIEGNRSERH